MFFGNPPVGVGVDIGTTSIKIVELQKIGDAFELKNYAEYRKSLEQKSLLTESTSFFLFEENLAITLKNLLTKAKIKEKGVIISLPVFSSFFTLIEFPAMPPEEISGAVKFQAHQYIPVPLSEVVLDWQIVEEDISSRNKIKILLVAVPKDIIEKYTKLSHDTEINLKALEIESFALVRSLISEEEPSLIFDIGGGTSSLTIVDRKVVRVSHGLDFYGLTLTRSLSKHLNISLERAEKLKKERGIKKQVENLIYPVLAPVIDKIIFVLERELNNYRFLNPNRDIKKIILSGGGALLPGIADYFCQKLKVETEIGNPFKDIIYSTALEEIIKEIGPTFAVAVGLAMRNIG